ncbi:MFS transporter [Actinocorallia lasiicapitis]
MSAPRVPLFTPRLVGLSLGFFMVLLDSTILNVALPDLSADLGGGVAAQQWTVNAYLVAFGALLLSSGAITDRYGATRVFRFGLAAFAVASLLCALAPTIGALVVLRGLQGATAAAVPVSTLALMGAMYPDAKLRARALGVWAALTGLGFAAGPLLGGVLVAAGGWRSVFLVNLPFAVAGLLLSRELGVTDRTRQVRLDWRSQLVAIAALALLTDTVIQAPEGRALLPGLLTALAFAVLFAAERRSPAPALPPLLLSVHDVRTAVLAGAAVQFQMAGGLFVLGLHFLDARRFGTVEAGLAFLPLTIAPLFGPLVGRLIARIGPRPTIRIGLTVAFGGNVLVGAGILAEAPFPMLVAAFTVLGFSVPLNMIPLTAQLVSAAPPGTAGTAGGLFNGIRQVGGALGVAVRGAIVAAWGPVDGTGYALLTSAATVLVTALILLAADLRRPARALV